jgi:GTP-binding protein Era
MFVSILGLPNVGKSSLLNRLLGEKIAIVSEKPQTTRTRIMGVLTQGETQLVFTDTPGLHRPRTKLGEHMVRAAHDSLDGVDACLFVTEAGRPALQEEETAMLRQLRRQPVILVLNKVDLLPEKARLARQIAQLSGGYAFAAVVPASALRGSNLDALREELLALADRLDLPQAYLFPEDTLTDQPERVIAAERIREQLLRLLDQEVPHGTAVTVEQMKERPGEAPLLDIEAVITCERESHKGILIGKGGGMLKTVGTRARKELEAFFGCQVNLKLWVKVKEDWRNREGLIKNFGLE